ncbi:hypothetical protein J6590_084382 [Homalodisca vitripennis]|nr:hypothetical protein J6590_084382 [Homalodisca vitripennis]
MKNLGLSPGKHLIAEMKKKIYQLRLRKAEKPKNSLPEQVILTSSERMSSPGSVRVPIE